MQIIIDKLSQLKDRISEAEGKYGREPGSVELVGVTKKQAIAKIKTAIDAGLTEFAENHLQEAIAKIQRLKKYNVHWHFIGGLQSNKTKPIAEYCSWVQSVDRAKIALRLSEQRPENLPPLNILLQVNIDQEPTKGGVNMEELPILAKFIEELPNLKLRGLMAIPTPRENFEEQREPFARMREAFEQLKVDGFEIDTLSMGMSSDFEAAIAEGSTMVRIGTDLFGDRGI